MRDGRTRCLNLLLTYDAGCAANCAYCGLARDRQGSSFIRVEWPSVPMAEVIERSKGRPLERMCISMITHRRAQRDTEALLTSWKREDALREVPVSILSNPSTMSREDLVALRELGAERFTVALDAVTPLRGEQGKAPLPPAALGTCCCFWSPSAMRYSRPTTRGWSIVTSSRTTSS